MEINNKYIFNNKDDLVNYLLYKLDLPSQLKIQKNLYLLFAFYGATYGKLSNDESNSELDSTNYTPFLFEPNFQAWKYGPVDYDVYINFKKEKYKELKSIENILNEDLTLAEKNNIIKFIDNIINQIDEIDDYSLMDRTREDKVWSDSYNNKEKNMNPYLIIAEYYSKYI